MATGMKFWQMTGALGLGHLAYTIGPSAPFTNPALLCEDMGANDEANPDLAEFLMRVWRNAGWWD